MNRLSLSSNEPIIQFMSDFQLICFGIAVGLLVYWSVGGYD